MTSHYFDYNATTPALPEVTEAMLPFLTEHFGNPSSIHHLGKVSARAVREARRKVAAFLGAADENEIIFTSGGTESNNAAIRSALSANPVKKQIITSAVEHSSVRKLGCDLAKEGYDVVEIGVDAKGQLDFSVLRNSISEKTAIVSLMMANNETGVLFPIDKVGSFLKEKGILFHVDGVQAVGKMPIVLKNLSIDFFSLSAHKFYGPKGTGALYVRNKTPLTSFIKGGAQERGRRAGTENVPGIIGLGTAADCVGKDLSEEQKRIGDLRDLFEQLLCCEDSGVSVNADASERLCNTSNLHFEQVDGEALLFALDQKGICASSGSACMSGSREPSHVLKAMGCSDDKANSSIRFSFGRFTTEKEIRDSAVIILQTAATLRSLAMTEQHERVHRMEISFKESK